MKWLHVARVLLTGFNGLAQIFRWIRWILQHSLYFAHSISPGLTTRIKFLLCAKKNSPAVEHKKIVLCTNCAVAGRVYHLLVWQARKPLVSDTLWLLEKEDNNEISAITVAVVSVETIKLFLQAFRLSHIKVKQVFRRHGIPTNNRRA